MIALTPVQIGVDPRIKLVSPVNYRVICLIIPL